MARRPRIRQIFPLLPTLFLVTATCSDPAEAFHSGGVGDCTGCHSIHRPEGGDAGTGNDNSISLMNSDPGSTCLKCHLSVGENRPDAYLVATADEDMPLGVPPAQLSPGGDFGWLKKSYRWGTGGGKVHPAGNNIKFSPAIAASYNAYVASGNLTGNSSTSYSSMVPFEMGTADFAVLKGRAAPTGGQTAGPGTSSNVMCLSCHRAHASGWNHAMRWNTNSEFLVSYGKYPGVEDIEVPSRVSQGRTRAEHLKTFYDRPATAYAAYQRSLCNKCHAKD